MPKEKKSKRRRPKVLRLIVGLLFTVVLGPLLIFVVAPTLEPMPGTNPAELAGVVFVFVGIGLSIAAFFKHDDLWSG